MQHPDLTWQLARERQARYGAEAGRSRRTDEANSTVNRATRTQSVDRGAGAPVDEQLSGSFAATLGTST
jgi:hypothetical protein